MKNKFLVEIKVPEVNKKFDIYLPINKKIGNVIILLNKAIADLTNGEYQGSNKTVLYNKITGSKYDINLLVRETDIKHGSSLILL